MRRPVRFSEPDELPGQGVPKEAMGGPPARTRREFGILVPMCREICRYATGLHFNTSSMATTSTNSEQP